MWTLLLSCAITLDSNRRRPVEVGGGPPDEQPSESSEAPETPQTPDERLPERAPAALVVVPAATPHDTGTVEPKDTGTEDPVEIAKHREVWEAAGVSDYDFALQWSMYGVGAPEGCDARGPAVVRVRGDAVVDVTWEDPMADTKGCFDAVTLDGVFDWVEEKALEAEETREIRFDTDYGFVEYASFDMYVGSDDDERGVTVTDFQARL